MSAVPHVPGVRWEADSEESPEAHNPTIVTRDTVPKRVEGKDLTLED